MDRKGVRLLAASIAVSSMMITAGLVAGNRYNVAVSNNAQSAWILDKWSGELTFCQPSNGQMASYLDRMKQDNPRVQEHYSNAEILEYLSEYDPERFLGMSPQQISQDARLVNPCLPSR